MIITPKSLTITQLLSAESEQYVVPAYQRRYSWHEKQLWELLEDVGLLEGSDSHLLGSIVCLTGYHKAGINELELVDGQQRLTTICILLQCILERFRKEGEASAAQDVERLLQARALGEQPVCKIQLDSLDADEFEQHLNQRTIDNPNNHNLAFAFQTFRKWASSKELKALGTFVYHLKNQCVVIRLDVSDAKDAFKLFETINNRGLKLSPTDIIKNFILGNAARFGPDALKLARSRWAELLNHLDGTSIESFFRHFLCVQFQRRITISFVIPYFKKLFMKQVSEAAKLPDRHWYSEQKTMDEENEEESESISADVDDPEEAEVKFPTVSFADFLERIAASAKVYGQLIHCKTGIPAIDRRLTHLRMIKAIQAYGFLMALRAGGCSDDNFIKVLTLTESFLLRRHVCRERANENESLFARLCSVDPKDPLAAILAEFRQLCPANEKFEHELAHFSFSPGLIDRARYCLEQFELKKHGKYPELLVEGPDLVHVEHIIPLKIKTHRAKVEFGDWSAYLGTAADTKHPHYVSRIGNLTLFAGPLNIGASNNPYGRKKEAYLKSALKLTHSLPSEFPEFRFEQVDRRSEEFAKLALEIWPMPS